MLPVNSHVDLRLNARFKSVNLFAFKIYRESRDANGMCKCVCSVTELLLSRLINGRSVKLIFLALNGLKCKLERSVRLNRRRTAVIYRLLPPFYRFLPIALQYELRTTKSRLKCNRTAKNTFHRLICASPTIIMEKTLELKVTF